MGGGGKDKKWYVVFVGRNPGVYDWWPECSAQVAFFSGAIYQSFDTREEAYGAYERWISMDHSGMSMGESEKLSRGQSEKLYVVFKGRRPGVYDSWPACKVQVNGYSGAVYRVYHGRAAAEAALERWNAGEGSSGCAMGREPIWNEPSRRVAVDNEKQRKSKRYVKLTLGEHNGGEAGGSSSNDVTTVDAEWLAVFVAEVAASLLATSLSTSGGKKDDKD